MHTIHKIESITIGMQKISPLTSWKKMHVHSFKTSGYLKNFFYSKSRNTKRKIDKSNYIRKNCVIPKGRERETKMQRVSKCEY